MYPQTYSIKKKQINYFNVFPKNRDFYFLDNYEKIKDFKTTNFDDPEYICVIAENKDRCIKENLYIRKDFLNDYDFIKVTEKASKIDLSFIISKSKINIGGSDTRLLTEIKLRPLLVKEIYKRSKINFYTNYMIYLKELFTVPKELKFYQRIFILFFQKQQNNNVNNNFNMNFNYANNFSNNNQLMNNNHINNNAFALNEFNNINNINNNSNNQILDNNNFNSYKNKEDRKGHTGFL